MIREKVRTYEIYYVAQLNDPLKGNKMRAFFDINTARIASMHAV